MCTYSCHVYSCRRTANCRALGYTTLYVLYKEDLSEALNDVRKKSLLFSNIFSIA